MTKKITSCQYSEFQRLMNALVTENIQEMENWGMGGWFTDKTMYIKTLSSKRKVKPAHSISDSTSLKLLITFP